MNKRAEELADPENVNADFTPFYEILIKQEPLDQHWPETCPNAQDPQFNVFKQEVCGDKSEMDRSRDNNSDVAAGTHSIVTHVKVSIFQYHLSAVINIVNMAQV